MTCRGQMSSGTWQTEAWELFFPKRGPAQKRLAAILPQQSRNSNPLFELPGAFPDPRVLFSEPRVAAHLVGLGDIGIYQQYWDMVGYLGLHRDMWGYIGISSDICIHLDIEVYFGIEIYSDIMGYLDTWGGWDRMR